MRYGILHFSNSFSLGTAVQQPLRTHQLHTVCCVCMHVYVCAYKRIIKFKQTVLDFIVKIRISPNNVSNLYFMSTSMTAI